MKPRRMLVVTAVLALTMFACASGSRIPAAGTPSVPVALPAPIMVQAPLNPAAAQDAFVALYKQVSPGVVIVKVTTSQGEDLGSGFAYDSNGHFVTNYHVVQGSSSAKVEVDFLDGYKSYATVIGTDPDSDLAVVKADAPASEFHPLTLGDSDALQIGQTVVAIGNPFAYAGSLSVGVVSGMHRTLDSLHATPGGNRTFTAGDLLQSDTPINPGNSGGPLFTIDGQVIGVIRAIETTTSNAAGQPTSAGVSFAVSSNIVKRVVPVIIQTGHYDYPYLGISSISLGNPSPPQAGPIVPSGLSLDEINALGLKQSTGTYVTDVVQGGPADQAGLKAGTTPTSFQGLNAGGDLIVAIDGRPVLQYDDLIAYLITQKSAGEKVVFTVIRNGQKLDLTLTLGKRP